MKCGVKMFLVFAGGQYYPQGGAEDLKGTFLLHEEAVKFLLQLKAEDYYDWAHLVQINDLTDSPIIKKYRLNDVYELDEDETLLTGNEELWKI